MFHELCIWKSIFVKQTTYLVLHGSAKFSGVFRLINIWDKVFKNGPSKICGWQALSRPYPFNCFKDCLLQILFHPFFWILCVNYIYNYWIIVLHCPATLRWKVRINLFRSSHRRCSLKNGVLRNFAKLTGKRMC